MITWPSSPDFPAGQRTRALVMFTVVLVVSLGALFSESFHRTRSPPGPRLRLSLNQSSSQPQPPFEITPPPQHTFLPNGLLAVDPRAADHPISTLIARAQDEWNTKLERASRTLEEAVEEYERRYERLPPKGFDVWWKWAVEEHAVQLPDEYDQIVSDLAPYWGISPADLQTLHTRRAQKDFMLVLGKDVPSDSVSILQSSFPSYMSDYDKGRFLEGAGRDQMSVLKDVEDLLPPFRILYWPHDNGNLFREWAAWSRAVETGKKGDGEYFDILNWDEEPNRPWESACSPDSPARLHPTNFSDPFPPPFSPISQHDSAHLKTFIHTPSAIHTPCAHPSLLRLHGTYLSSHPSLGPYQPARPPSGSPQADTYAELLVPQLSASHVALKDDITTANAYGFVDTHPGGRLEWEEKVVGPDGKGGEKVLWRGRTTGIGYNDASRWRETQRPRLVEIASVDDDPGYPLERPRANYSACVLPPPSSDPNNRTESGPCTDVPVSNLSHTYLDIAFTGSASNPIEAIQCEGTPAQAEKVANGEEVEGQMGTGTCEQLVREYAWGGWVNNAEEGRWKFIFDVDGNGWSGRFKRLLTSGSVVLKATAYPEWFTDRIQPWVHYVPVQMDYSDLFDILAYFRGEVPSSSAPSASSSSDSSPADASESAEEALDDTTTNGKRNSQEDSEDAAKETVKKRQALKEEADARARAVGEAGRAWTEVFWRREDLTAYQFRLILEYIRIMSPDRDSNPEAVSYRYPSTTS